MIEIYPVLRPRQRPVLAIGVFLTALAAIYIALLCLCLVPEKAEADNVGLLDVLQNYLCLPVHARAGALGLVDDIG